MEFLRFSLSSGWNFAGVTLYLILGSTVLLLGWTVTLDKIENITKYFKKRL
jgi:hypothetical protein